MAFEKYFLINTGVLESIMGWGVPVVKWLMCWSMTI